MLVDQHLTLPYPRTPAAASGDSARTKDAPALALSPGKSCEAALVGPSEERQRAVGTPDYLAPELLLGALLSPEPKSSFTASFMNMVPAAGRRMLPAQHIQLLTQGFGLLLQGLAMATRWTGGALALCYTNL